MADTAVMDQPKVVIPPSKKRLNKIFDFDFMQIPLFNKAVKSRLFQPVLILINLAVFVVLIMAGLVGTPVGNKNAAIMMIWIFWFFLLIALMVPIGGRSWCIMCPLPAPGEWLARLGIVRKSKRTFPNFGLKWPKRLDNIWLQNLGFLGVATLSPIILTRPWATSYMLIFMIALGVILSFTFKRQNKPGRIFCRYLCPVGGFIGLYSLTGALEVKVKDTVVCDACRSKACVRGSEKGWGCPWYEFPTKMDRNAYCGLCSECLKTCPNDNIAFKTRPFGADLLKKAKMDEAFKSFIMLGSGLLFLTVFFGWWGSLKDIADPLSGVFPSSQFRWQDIVQYFGILWGVSLVAIPLLHLGSSWLAKRATRDKSVPLKTIFVSYSYALVPLGLMAWIGFVVGMFLVNGSYVVSVISDPFGWGWNLLGTAGYEWQPWLPGFVPFIQLATILVGLVLSMNTGFKVSMKTFQEKTKALRAMIPMSGLMVALAVVFIYLFVMV
jgi:polyferredoxin